MCACCRSLGTCLKVRDTNSPPGTLCPIFLQLASLLEAVPYQQRGCAEGKAGSLVDDAGHFYKPLQVCRHMPRPCIDRAL